MAPVPHRIYLAPSGNRGNEHADRYFARRSRFGRDARRGWRSGAGGYSAADVSAVHGTTAAATTPAAPRAAGSPASPASAATTTAASAPAITAAATTTTTSGASLILRGSPRNSGIWFAFIGGVHKSALPLNHSRQVTAEVPLIWRAKSLILICRAGSSICSR
jgi:hypothetical protein